MSYQERTAQQNLAGLLPMSYLSTAFLALAILTVGMVRLEGAAVSVVSCVAMIMLFLALGSLLRVRWAIVAAMVLATVVWGAAVVALATGVGRPPFIYLLIPPLVVGFNYIALKVTCSDESS